MRALLASVSGRLRHRIHCSTLLLRRWPLRSPSLEESRVHIIIIKVSLVPSRLSCGAEVLRTGDRSSDPVGQRICFHQILHLVRRRLVVTV